MRTSPLPEAQEQTSLQRSWARLRSITAKQYLIGVLAFFILPALLVGFLIVYGHKLLLYLAVWLRWCWRGTRVFVVYARNAPGQDRFEKQLLPSLPASAIVVDSANRKHGSGISLASQVYNNFLGNFEPTPSVIVFQPFRPARVYRFHSAYDRYEKGDPGPVQALESELLGSFPQT